VAGRTESLTVTMGRFGHIVQLAARPVPSATAPAGVTGRAVELGQLRIHPLTPFGVEIGMSVADVAAQLKAADFDRPTACLFLRQSAESNTSVTVLSNRIACKDHEPIWSANLEHVAPQQQFEVSQVLDRVEGAVGKQPTCDYVHAGGARCAWSDVGTAASLIFQLDIASSMVSLALQDSRP
jgi:hypothetical protein